MLADARILALPITLPFPTLHPVPTPSAPPLPPPWRVRACPLVVLLGGSKGGRRPLSGRSQLVAIVHGKE
jgi:hypothetical protein